MLRAGYGLATYDGKSTGGIRGWNTVDRVAMLKELIDTVKAKYTVKKGVIYGSSQAGSIMTPFIEQYPDLCRRCRHHGWRYSINRSRSSSHFATCSIS